MINPQQKSSNDGFIPVNTPLLNGNEKKYILECLDTGWISSEGPFISKFENEFAKRMGRKFGIAVCNGSAALDIAVAALGIGPGDEVIIPSFTIISCAAAIVRAGATPIAVDSDPETWNIDLNAIESKITKRTKAIMPVHIYGLPVDMNPLLELASKHGLFIIEDAAEAHGLNYNGKPCGSFGEISTFSFYPNKHITTGEGGMCVTDDPAIAERCRLLRNLYFSAERRFYHEELGWNMRMTNLQAALGLAQLEQLEAFVEKKLAMGRFYNEKLSGLDNIQLAPTQTSYAKNIYWVFGIVLKDSVKMNAVDAMKELTRRGIGTRPFFYPMHLQPALKKLGLFSSGESLPVSERIAERGFYIPSGLGLTQNEMQRVVDSVRDVLRG